ncbi:MAG: aminotransferase class III-fold pyridoxal phosphate-dependent enzyme [Bacteroidales bacterium]
MEKLFENHNAEMAAFIVEPILQGAGGMRLYNAMYLRKIRELCTRYDVLMIADEIATGFGRTGELLACNHALIVPDILCLGKALTGGYMTLAVTITTEKIAQTISSASPGVFMHGPTFMANPLACAVAAKSVELLIHSSWKSKVKSIENQCKEELNQLKNHTLVQDVRILGAVAVVETVKPLPHHKVLDEFISYGAWIRPIGKAIYLMPPYSIKENELSILTNSIIKVLNNA